MVLPFFGKGRRDDEETVGGPPPAVNESPPQEDGAEPDRPATAPRRRRRRTRSKSTAQQEAPATLGQPVALAEPPPRELPQEPPDEWMAGTGAATEAAEQHEDEAPRKRRRRRTRAKPKEEEEKQAAEAQEAEAPAEVTEPEAEAAAAEPKKTTRRRTRKRGEKAAEEAGKAAEAEAREKPAARAARAAAAPELSPLEALVARQNVILDTLLSQQGEMLNSLQQTLSSFERGAAGGGSTGALALPKVGIFVDVPNIMYAADRIGITIDFGRLLQYLTRGRHLVRATAYAPISDDPLARLENQRFVQPFVNHGYRIVTKPLKRFTDGSIKANFDVELAMDVLTMSDRLDVVSLVSGDGDFRRLVELVASKGVRVEVVAFGQSTAAELRAVCDSYVDIAVNLKEFKTR